MSYKIAVVVGSLRRDSINRKLANALEKLGPADFSFSQVRLDDLPGKPAGVIGASGGAPGTSLAQQHLRNILAYLDMPTLGQPEAFIQVKEGFFGADGSIANESSRKFLQTWMDRYVAWVKKHAA